ncbi:MAG: hypothetical protein WBA74_01705 [Cyclobacteriaceae bacterium]
MYKTKDIKKEQLQKVKIDHQEEIKRFTNNEFVPLNAWQLIKEGTDNFTVDLPKYREADELLYKILQKGGVIEKLAVKKPDLLTQTKAKARKRKMKLLKLKYKYQQAS